MMRGNAPGPDLFGEELVDVALEKADSECHLASECSTPAALFVAAVIRGMRDCGWRKL